MVNDRWVRRVMVVEDQPLMCTLVGSALEHAGFTVHTATTAAEALAVFDGFDPDLLVTDVDLGARPNGIDLANIVAVKAPACAIVFLTNYPNASSAPGSSGVPPKSLFVDKGSVQSTDQLVEVVETALAESSLPDGGAADSPLAHLTRSQLDLLRYIALGWSNAAIAAHRGSSIRGVEKLIARTLGSLDLVHDPAINPRVLAAGIFIRHFGPPEDIDSA
ncbi:response regulator [Rhodococcus sp. IEGM 1379]|uniref:response regulator n=1 Tax=Rhodococcus sp. IEGM 1379 TaxID=3047086 RepID=UPI0024B72D9B|nr:response regulator [Rhodococcus sp. IEGM 1379]MDI9916603.1 response regulator [Rhodococcus sp. IEGM 1379]